MVDVEDIMGTSVTNVSKEILKFKIAPDSGHRQEFYIDEQPSIVHEELDAEEAEMHMAMPTELPRLKDDDFERVVKQGDVSLIAFGAPWCPWSQRLEPIWRKTRGCAVQSAACPCPPPPPPPPPAPKSRPSGLCGRHRSDGSAAQAPRAPSAASLARSPRATQSAAGLTLSLRLSPEPSRYAELQDKPYATHVRMGKVDCTSADSQALCQKHHIHAFPTIRIYRRAASSPRATLASARRSQHRLPPSPPLPLSPPPRPR